jgi:mRNA-degrading endonuclease toxin of MazEF toxin-antitoxin module
VGKGKAIQRGSIVWAFIADPSGRNIKDRPALVVDGQSHIDSGSDLHVVVISTDFSYPLAPGWFDLPSGLGGVEKTGLPEACVVKCDWIDTIPQLNVLRVSGRAPATVVKTVINWLNDELRRERRTDERG